MSAATGGRLGDTVTRTYNRKLELFNRFAEPELRQALTMLDLQPGQRVLDAGCGIGMMANWMAEAVGPGGLVIGLDLSQPHVRDARVMAADARIVLGDVTRLPLKPRSLDRIWCSNTINHVREPASALTQFVTMARPGAVIALGQGYFLPEMIFAWEHRLEQLVVRANQQYFRDKYGLREHDLADVRNLIKWVRDAGLMDVRARTFLIERVQPLRDIDRAYLHECVFEGYWGKRIEPYLDAIDIALLKRMTDPDDPEYSLDRADFHYLQSYTVVTGICPH
jgi:ubiquinone/menaquinone biosynthesis C-methylase UbiE